MHRVRPTWFSLGIAGCLLLCFVAAPTIAFATVAYMDLPALTQSADTIVVAHVSGQAAHAEGPMAWAHRLIYTDSSLSVEQILKGSSAGTKTLRQPGGTVGFDRLSVSDLPSLERGERCILFLNASGGVVDGYQGKLDVVHGVVPATDMSLADTIAAIRNGGTPPAPPAPLSRSVSAAVAATSGAAASPSVAAVSVAPTISDIQPPGANAGTGERVLVTGSGFGSTPGSVTFPDGSGLSPDAATIVSWADNAIVCIVPANAEAGGVVVKTAGNVSSAAFTYGTGFSTSGMKWNSSAISYYINGNCPNVSAAAASAAIQNDFTVWDSTGSRFHYSYAGPSTHNQQPTSTFGSNNIFWAGGFSDPGILAWNMTWYDPANPGTILESDIVLNSQAIDPWYDGAAPGRFDIQSIALHEMGHTLQLDDQYDNTYKVMGAMPSGVTRRVLTQYEINGELYLWDAPSSPTITSPTDPSQTSWYSTGTTTFNFSSSGPSAVDGFSYVLDTSPVTVPDTVSEGSGAVYSTSGLADGIHWFHVRAHSANGVWSLTSHYAVNIDALPPAGGTTIGNPAVAYVSNPVVPITSSVIDAGSGLNGMRTNNGTGWGAWTAYAASTSVTLPSTDGTHTVSVQYRDKVGNVLTNSRDVALDVTPPSTVASYAAGWQHGPVGVSVSASDALSGVSAIKYQVGAGAVLDYSGPFQVASEGSTAVKFWSVDAAGNIEPPHTINVLVDTTPPTTTSDALPSYPGTATITFTATDAGSGVATTSYSVDGATWADGTTVDVGGAGTHSIQFMSVDVLGNTEPTRTATFTMGDNITITPSIFSAAWGSPTNPAATVVVPYGTTATLYGTLTDSGGNPLAGLPGAFVVVEYLNGATWSSAGALAAGPAPGQYSFVVRPSMLTQYRLRFLGDATSAPSTSAMRSVMPNWSVSKPTVPKNGRRTKSISVSGVLAPAGAAGSSRSVKLGVYQLRRVRGRNVWSQRKSVWAKLFARDAGSSRYAATFRISSAGKWSIVAAAQADGRHAARNSARSSTIVIR